MAGPLTKRSIVITPRTAEMLSEMDERLGLDAVDQKVNDLLCDALPPTTSLGTENGCMTSALHNERRALKICINNANHGPAAKGGRCQACWDKKKRSENAGSWWKRFAFSWAVIAAAMGRIR